MKILALDTSSMMGSVALLDDDVVVAEQLLNIKVTHSERLISSVDSILKSAGCSINDVDGFAVAIGPGSFTGLRIGLAAVKGLAFSLKKPVVGISTLKGLAYNAYGSGMPVVAVLDARRGEYYAGIYDFSGGRAKVLLKNTVLPPAELIKKVKALKRDIIFVGDGIYGLKKDAVRALKKRVFIAPPGMIHPRASNIGWLAMPRFLSGKTDDLDGLAPNYIRKSDAEKKS